MYHVSLTPLSSRGNEMKNRGIRAGTGYGSPAGIGEVRFSRVTRTDRVHMLYSCPQMPGGSSYCRSGISLRRGSPPCQSGPFTAPDCPSRSPKSGISCKNAPFSCTVFRKSVHCPDLWQSACFTRYFLNINRQFPEAKVGCMWKTAWLNERKGGFEDRSFPAPTADLSPVYDGAIPGKGETFSGSSVSDGEVPVRPPPGTPGSGEFGNKGTIRRFSCPIRAPIHFSHD